MVTNSISEKVEFLVEPSHRATSEHLNKEELSSFLKVNSLDRKLFNTEEVATLLYNSGKVPLWINCEISRSTKHKTTVTLTCSRRYREDHELNHRVDEFPPFHLLVAIPPWRKKEEKFNISWRQQTLKRKWHALTWKRRNDKV